MAHVRYDLFSTSVVSRRKRLIERTEDVCLWFDYWMLHWWLLNEQQSLESHDEELTAVISCSSLWMARQNESMSVMQIII